jgi:hypothetical protein
VNIEAPDASVAVPLILAFEWVHPTPSPLIMFRNNEPINSEFNLENCTDGTTADPDPCVESITDNSPTTPTTTVVVRTSIASSYNIGSTDEELGNCMCVVKNIFPGGTVANLRFNGKPTMTKALGADINAVDRIENSGLCPDDPEGPYEIAEAQAHILVEDVNGHVLLETDRTIECVSGVDNPNKFIVTFTAENCGVGGYKTGTFDIFTTVSANGSEKSRTQKIRCRD